MASQALLVFARAPQVGQAKTRLIPALGAEGAAALHAGLVERTLQTACGNAFDVLLWCHPDTHHPFFRDCADRFPLGLHAQAGGDLGARMAHALNTALAQHDHAVLIGTDCPDLDVADLATAFQALRAGTDVVIGPATDGGYYLIGLKRHCDALFADIDWGTSLVMNQTLARATQLGLSMQLLANRHDLDTPQDLVAFDDCAAVLQKGRALVESDQ